VAGVPINVVMKKPKDNRISDHRRRKQSNDSGEISEMEKSIKGHSPKRLNMDLTPEAKPAIGAWRNSNQTSGTAHLDSLVVTPHHNQKYEAKPADIETSLQKLRFDPKQAIHPISPMNFTEKFQFSPGNDTQQRGS